MDQSFPPVSLGGMPREIRDIIYGYLVKEEKVIYHKVIIAGTRPVYFSSFTIRGYGQVCRQFRAEYAETLNKHIQHITIVGDLNGDKLFDTNRYRFGFRAKIALGRQANNPSWECHPVLPSLSHIRLQSSFTHIVFEAFQENYAVLHGQWQKVSVSFEFLLSNQAREAVRHQEATLYDNIFSAAELQQYMQARTENVRDITQVENKRFTPSPKPIIAVRKNPGRRRTGESNSYHNVFKALCNTMRTICNQTTWPAVCCFHQNCNCFTAQVHAYINSILRRCRAFPDTPYVFDSYKKQHNPSVSEVDGLHQTRNYRNQFRDSWVTGCNRNFEMFSESGSEYMDIEQYLLTPAMATSNP